MVELSDEQSAIADAASAFLTARRVERPYFLFDGAAGTGKTEVLAEIGRRFPNATACVPIGKVASVLGRRMGREVTTVHSAIYAFRGQFTDEESGEIVLSFRQKIRDGAWRGRIALLDEAGTVSQDLGSDLIATGCRVVACGDPHQLRPVRSTRFFEHADMGLKTVRRQALESAVLRQAHNVLATGRYAADGEDFRVARSVGRDDILAADVILCWRNATRQALNALVRAHRGLDGPPIAGEQIVCLRNDHDLGILNGARYELLVDYDALRRVARMRNERGHVVDVENCFVEGIDPLPDPNDRNAHPLASGDAMTVHKFIGSETETGILVDEYDRYEDRTSFLYTGITRFAKRVLVHSTWA